MDVLGSICPGMCTFLKLLSLPGDLLHYTTENRGGSLKTDPLQRLSFSVALLLLTGIQHNMLHTVSSLAA